MKPSELPQGMRLIRPSLPSALAGFATNEPIMKAKAMDRKTNGLTIRTRILLNPPDLRVAWSMIIDFLMGSMLFYGKLLLICRVSIERASRYLSHAQKG